MRIRWCDGPTHPVGTESPLLNKHHDALKLRVVHLDLFRLPPVERGLRRSGQDMKLRAVPETLWLEWSRPESSRARVSPEDDRTGPVARESLKRSRRQLDVVVHQELVMHFMRPASALSASADDLNEAVRGRICG